MSRWCNLQDDTLRVAVVFSCSETNVDYQVVAAFLTEGETTENITAVLTKIKEWNPGFNPPYAMVNCCSEEINALDTLHPGKW